MFDRKFVENTKLLTGSRVIKSRPVEIIDIETNDIETSIDLPNNNTKLVLSNDEAFELAMSILSNLPKDATKKAVERLTQTGETK